MAALNLGGLLEEHDDLVGARAAYEKVFIWQHDEYSSVARQRLEELE
jgi:hypothetical protein